MPAPQPRPGVPAGPRESDPTPPPSPLAGGTRLYTPGAHVVSTRRLGEVTEALTHTVAAHGIMGVYGDPATARPSRSTRRCVGSRAVSRYAALWWR
ncbi:hypothetical protein [Embleya sp. NPDC005971]|uniref:hypothetical protein n=1 Tax=Embleya sp. NPDC005971 TaxID=3156724 RepID=UPI003408FE36